MKKNRIDSAIEAGTRNLETVELVKNWCTHAEVIRGGGIGMVEQMTGLPIGHFGVSCKFASRSGFMSWDLADAACTFHDDNCVGCGHRSAVGMPNLSVLIAKRDEAIRREEIERARRSAEIAKAKGDRQIERSELRAKLDAVGCTLVDQLDDLDQGENKDAKQVLLKSVRVAPEALTEPLVDYIYRAVERGEPWITEAGLTILRDIGLSPQKLSRLAALSLARYDQIWLASDLLNATASHVEESLVRAAVPALIDVAMPAKSPFHSQRAGEPKALLAIHSRFPKEVLGGIEDLLGSRNPRKVQKGARATSVLFEQCICLPENFFRSLAAILARAETLLDDDPYDTELDQSLGEVSHAFSKAWLADPVQARRQFDAYFDGARAEGQKRLVGALADVLRSGRLDRKLIISDAHESAIRLLVDLAITSKEYEVLSAIQDVFHGEPYELTELVRRCSDVMLGAAAVLDGEQERLSAYPAIEIGELGMLDRHNLRRMVGYLKEGLVTWAAHAARNDLKAARSYVQFIEQISSERESFKAKLVSKLGPIMSDPESINLALPTIYSMLVGSSSLLRASAADALRQLRHSRVAEDLPDLIYEALLAQLGDSYIIVHQAALRVIDDIGVPEKFLVQAKSSVLNLLLHYGRGQDKISNADHFFVNCVEVYFQLGQVGEREGRAPILEFITEKLTNMDGYIVSNVLPRIRKELESAEGYSRLLGKLLTDRESRGSDLDSIWKVIQSIPSAAVRNHSSDWVRVGEQLVAQGVPPGPLIEILTRAAQWDGAEKLAVGYRDQIPDTVRDAPRRQSGTLGVLATQFERAVAQGDFSTIEKVQNEWHQVAKELGKWTKDEQARHPFAGIPTSHRGSPGTP